MSARRRVQIRANVGLAAASGAVLVTTLAAYAGIGPVPLYGLAEDIMARTPPGLANTLLDLFGPLARPSAVLGAFALVLLAGGGAGALTALGRAGTAAAALLWTGGLFAMGTLGFANAWATWVIGMALFFLIIVLGQPRFVPHDPSRRHMLLWSVAGAAAVMVTANTAFLAALGGQLRLGREGGRRIFPWRNPHPRDAAFAPAPTPEVSDIEDFYVMSKNVVDPQLSASGWRLTVNDEADTLDTYRLEDLQALPRSDIWATLRCVSNAYDSHELMDTAMFSGVPLWDLVDPGDASYVRFRGHDGHEEVHEVAQLQQVPALLVYALNGRELSQAHGYPLRLLAPGQYGFRNVKWLTEITFLDEPDDGTWAARGWTAEDVHPCSFVDGVVATGNGREAFGVAYAPGGVGRVEVRVDEGGWTQAGTLDPLSGHAWTMWRAPVDASSGRVTVRMFDRDGAAQPGERQDSYPDGATGLHTISFG